MSIVEMQKIHLASLSQDKDKILAILQDLKIIHIQKLKEKGEELGANLPDLDLKMAELKSTISFLEKLAPQKKSFVDSFISPKIEITKKEIKKTASQFNYKEITEKHKHLENKLNNLKNLSNELKSEYEKILPWKALDAPLNSLADTANTRLVCGTVKTKALNDFKMKVAKSSSQTEIIIVNQDSNQTYLALIFLIGQRAPFENLLSKSTLNTICLPASKHTPAEELQHIQKVQKEVRDEMDKFLKEARDLLPHLNQLKYVYDYFLETKTQLATKQNFFDSAHAFIIEGWIKKKDLDKLKAKISAATKSFELFKIEPNEGEKPPVFIKNPKLASPFELITKVYGTPKNEDLDPTLPLSFFFALFFGLCLGDFGYGLTLALASVYFLKKYKLPEGGKNLFELLLMGGLVSVVVGILTGSYFGFNPQNIPPALFPLKNLLLSIRIIDPIKSPLVMLVFSLALGVIQILFGISLQMINNIRNRDYAKAILDDFLWMFFLGSLVFLIVSTALTLPIAAIASKMSISGAVFLVLTQGRHKKNIIQKLLSGLLSLYKITGYMGDTLSYSRLLALGMSSAIIGSVINILAGMVKESVPVLGIVFMVVLLIVGHIFNLVISTLGAFVHSMRLQMVEFFSKFYEGGGREFRPFKRVAEYTTLKGG